MPKNVNITTIISILDLIAPHSCRGCGRIGNVLCDGCKKYILQNASPILPKSLPKNFPPIYSIGERSGLLSQLIHEYKYNSTRAIGNSFAELLNAKLPIFKGNIAIVPLPTSTNHIRERGFDHTLYLAKKLAKLRHYKVEPILIRNKNTTQVGTDRKTRLKQADSAFIVSKKAKINLNTTYLLLDDVWTTGASMKSAVKKLRESGAQNIIVALLAISTLDD